MYLLEVQGEAESVGALDNFDRSLGKADASASQTTKSTSSLGKEMGAAAAGITSAATGAFSLYQQYDELEKLELRVAKAQKGQEDATRQLSKAQEALDKLVGEGITTGVDYEQALSGLESAKQGVAIADERLVQTQGDVSERYVGFALSVMPTVTGAITGAQGAMKALSAMTIITNAATGASAGIFSAAGLAAVGHKIALFGSTLATQSLTVATKLLHLAMGPIGLAILGVSTFMALFATNAFGIRDAMNAAGKAIGDAIPILRPLLDALSSLANMIFPQTEEASDEASTGIEDDLDALAEKYKLNASESADMGEGVALSFEGMSAETQKALEALAKSMDKNADSVVADANRMKGAMKDVGKVSDADLFSAIWGQQGGGNKIDVGKIKAGLAGSSSTTAERMTATFNITIKIGEKDLKRVFGDVKSGDTLQIF